MDMPTYEYRCQDCDKEFSLVLSMTRHDREQVVCPGCGSHRVTQKFSPFFAKTSRKS